jgi:type II secretory pathway component GspD/PulD (secretin)
VFPLAQSQDKPVDEMTSYRPRGRSIEFLRAVAKAAGVNVVDHNGKGSERLVFGGSAEAVEKARKILAEVDSPPESVTVRAVLVEYMDGNTESRSLNIALSALGEKLGIGYIAGQGIGNVMTWRAPRLNTVLSAIDGDSRFRYIAEPSIRVVDGESAKFTVGSEQPTRGSVTTDNNGNATQAIDYKTAGVQINIEPRILADHVQIKISQEMSSFALTTTSNIDSPTILKRSASTTVSVRPGELIVLAGLDERKDTSSSSGLFFLPDWMRGTNHDDSRSQLVLMLEVQSDVVPGVVPDPPGTASESDPEHVSEGEAVRESVR